MSGTTTGALATYPMSIGGRREARGAVISSNELQAGACYFLVTYEDGDPTVPVVETLRFKNKVSEGDSGATFVFDRVGGVGLRRRRLPEKHLTTVFEFGALVSEFAAHLDTQRAGAPYEPRYCDD